MNNTNDDKLTVTYVRRQNPIAYKCSMWNTNSRTWNVTYFFRLSGKCVRRAERRIDRPLGFCVAELVSVGAARETLEGTVTTAG